MFNISPIGGFQSAVITLMVSSAIITLFEPLSSGARAALQDEIAAPPDERAMEKFMVRKLAAAQRALEGVSRGDFELIRKSSTEMSELSRHEVWERMSSARFVQDTADFVTAAEFLDRMAEAQDSEGVSLGFVRLTLTCANCHAHIRSSSVAMKQFDHNHALAGR